MKDYFLQRYTLGQLLSLLYICVSLWTFLLIKDSYSERCIRAIAKLTVYIFYLLFLEWLYSFTHCCQEESNADSFHSPQLWRRDEHRDKAGSDATPPGLTGGAHGYGHLASG